MKTLADEIVDLIPAHPEGLTIARAAEFLAADAMHVRKAFGALNRAQRASLMRREGSRVLFLLPIEPRGTGLLRICPVCASAYRKKQNGFLKACSRICSTTLAWDNPERRAEVSSEMAKRHGTPDARRRQSERSKKFAGSPEAKAAQSARSKQQWKDPAYRAKTQRALRAAFGAPEMRKNISDKALARWSDPEFKSRVRKSIRVATNRPQVRKKRSEDSKAMWADPQKRAEMTAKLAEANASPEKRAKHRSGALKSWADPEVKKRRIKKVLATRAKTRSYRRAPEKLETLRRMLAEGATCEAAGAVIGESGSYVWQWAKDEGIPTRSRRERIQQRMADPAWRRHLSIAVSAAKNKGRPRKSAEARP